MIKSVAAVSGVLCLVGILVGFGIFGSLSVTQAPCGTGTLNAQFTTQEWGFQVNVTDKSTTTGSGVSLIITNFNWGDGSNDSVNPHGSTHHNYAGAGTFPVRQNVLAQCIFHIGPFPVPLWFNGTSEISVTLHSSTSNGTNSTPGSVTASFTPTVSKSILSIADQSTKTGSATITSIQISWGDGGGATENTLGFVANHTYANAGNFTVEEIINWENGQVPEQSNASASISIAGGGGGGGGGSGGQKVTFTWSDLTGLLFFGFGFLAVAALALPADPKLIVIAGVIALPVGTLLGYVLGSGAVL